MLSKESIIEYANRINTVEFNKSKTAQTNKERFDNITALLAGSVWFEHDVTQTAQYITRLIIEYLNNNQAISSLENIESISSNDEILSVFHKLQNMVLPEREWDEEVVEKTIDICEMPILLSPWNGNRIINNLFQINDANPFDGERYFYNIHNTLIKPLNVIVCSGANHSQFAAKIINQGKTIINYEYDIRDMYDRIEFDGNGYKKIGNVEYLQVDAKDDYLFYSGVLFELGRINIQ